MGRGRGGGLFHSYFPVLGSRKAQAQALSSPALHPLPRSILVYSKGCSSVHIHTGNTAMSISSPELSPNSGLSTQMPQCHQKFNTNEMEAIMLPSSPHIPSSTQRGFQLRAKQNEQLWVST